MATSDGRLAFAISYFDRDITASTLVNSGTFGIETARAGFAVRFQDLIVYNETNGNVGFQETDQVVRIIDLDTLTRPAAVAAGWGFNVATNTRTFGDGNNVHVLNLRTVNNALALRVFAGDHPFRVDGNRVKPDELKISFMINGSSPAIPPLASGLRVALRAVVIAGTSRRTIDGTASTELAVSGDRVVSTAFNWAKQVNVTSNGNRVTANVHTEIVATYENATLTSDFASSFTATRLVWSLAYDYDVGNRVIEWDPAAAAAVDYAALDSAGVALSQPVVLAVLALLATFFFLL